MSSTYIEPGVYVSNEVSNAATTNSTTVKMYPLIVGRMPKTVPATLTIMRTCGQTNSTTSEIVPFDPIDRKYGNSFSPEYVKAAFNSAIGYDTTEASFKFFTTSDGLSCGIKWCDNKQAYKKYYFSNEYEKMFADGVNEVLWKFGGTTDKSWREWKYVDSSNAWKSDTFFSKDTQEGATSWTAVGVGGDFLPANYPTFEAGKYYKLEDGQYVLLSESPSGWSSLATTGNYPNNGFYEKDGTDYRLISCVPEFTNNAYYRKMSLYGTEITMGSTTYYMLDAVSTESVDGYVGIFANDAAKTGYEMISSCDSEKGQKGICRMFDTTKVSNEGNVPALNTAYTIKFNFSPSTDSGYYDIHQWESLDDVVAYYGKEETSVDYSLDGFGYNPIPLASRILKEAGTKNFFTLAIQEDKVAYVKNANDKFLTYVAPTTPGAQGTWEETTNPADYYIVAKGEYVVDGASSITATYAYEKVGDNYKTVTGSSVAPLTIDNNDYLKNNEIYRLDEDSSFKEKYKSALRDKCFGLEAEQLYRIVPLNQGSGIATYCRNHVNEASTDEERNECGCFVSIAKGSTTDETYITNTKSLAKSTLNSARCVTSLGSAVKTLKSGYSAKLNTQFLLCYLAGLETTKTDGTGLTNTTIPLSSFNALDIPLTRRSEKNDVAESGVLLFEQRPSTEAIKVRHALTTLYADKFGKEMSVQYNIDYTRKYLRAICNPYIGVRNVTSETVELITQTLENGLDTLVSEGRLTYGTLTKVAVAENAPDTLVVELKVKVAFPLNYIYITLVLDN